MRLAEQLIGRSVPEIRRECAPGRRTGIGPVAIQLELSCRRPMIYSRFGTKLTLLSKEADASGRVLIHATAADAEGVRQYLLADLKADEGMAEITDAVAKLPVKDPTVTTGTKKVRPRF